MILRKDMHGEEVALLQRRLARAGYPVEDTHVYDDATERAVMALQQAGGLVVDGIYGPKSQMALLGARQPKHLSDADLIAAADKLGVPVYKVRAVNEVESNGLGFLPDGRPKILFERHVFWKRLKAHGIDPAPFAAKHPKIVSQQTGGYQGGASEYIRLAAAEAIHPVAAREAASWGAYQIMGYHWKAMGYPSLVDFVVRMETSEAEHLDAFVRYMLHVDPSLVAALKAGKYQAFAKGFNGPGYAANLYDVKLARAADRYRAFDKASQAGGSAEQAEAVAA
ncbi:N-acetylmuramidase family protein [Cupriavidus sp. UGS-1]|uniref:N-acetylmuramidase domain-containing protein n=1 Tax=Cupriavidus sp. UGS-1 TaxID=2899826 RepID=UPI001E4E86A1|nr:N-acetylmuramidase family protein [Cupriavidus sp. UGS-1]MCD9124029.1 N-acetylmuramidase family protein [Cupriavidus sp. UGS-1]